MFYLHSALEQEKEQQCARSPAHVKPASTEDDESQSCTEICTVHTVFTTLSVPDSSQIIHSFRDLLKQRIPTAWMSDIFCNSQKPTLEASHACSPCVQVKHS